MQGDFLSSVLLPLMLGFIMFSLGLGLALTDFRRILLQPKAFLIGFLCHFVILPTICFIMLSLFPLPGALAVGFMIVAACPTGPTSNLLTYMARGDVALAISFTAAASVVSIFTVPLIISFAMNHFLGANQQIAFPVGYVMAQLLIILGLPVTLGMVLRHWKPAFVTRFEPIATRIASVCFAIIVIGALVKNWAFFVSHFSTLAPLAVGLNLTMMAIGFSLSRLVNLDRRQSVTLAIETAVQNASLAIVIGSSLLKQDDLALPGAVYGILMYVGGLAFVMGVRRFGNLPAKATG